MAWLDNPSAISLFGAIALASLLGAWLTTFWQWLARDSVSDVLTGFLAVLGRTSLIVVFAVLLRLQVARVDFSAEWPQIGHAVMLTSIFGCFVLAEIAVLASKVL